MIEFLCVLVCISLTTTAVGIVLYWIVTFFYQEEQELFHVSQQRVKKTKKKVNLRRTLEKAKKIICKKLNISFELNVNLQWIDMKKGSASYKFSTNTISMSTKGSYNENFVIKCMVHELVHYLDGLLGNNRKIKTLLQLEAPAVWMQMLLGVKDNRQGVYKLAEECFYKIGAKKALKILQQRFQQFSGKEGA